jgi:hypothetical protein
MPARRPYRSVTRLMSSVDEVLGTLAVGLDNATSAPVVRSTDRAATTVELQLAEVALQATLAGRSRVLQPSLVDFLR